MADRLTPSQIYTLLLDGGFSQHDARIMTAIAQAESARDPGAVGDVRLENHTWGPSVGLFQVRTLKAETGRGTDRDIEHLMGNPRAQVTAALHISSHGNNFRPWSTYTSGSYRKFLDAPLHAGAELPAGMDFSGSSANPPGDHPGDSGALDPFAIDKGKPPARIAIADSDGDGLTDAFEKKLGTDPHLADTDHDGLSDADEYAQQDSDHDGLSDAYEHDHGTDPNLADTDHDGLSDADEIARGTDPNSLDSNHDGLTDGFSAANSLPSESFSSNGLPSSGLSSNGLTGNDPQGGDLQPDDHDADLDVHH
jgi:hypothetical protein